ncbi:protein kinase [Ornithinibacillus gellani]|uniref:protein kinase n=1 Tax=Ornithinibacillus gellani TaxID=2293253 RepID=UPI000F474BD5|nr:protein kinase [Ornithinibacillus gellani]TQS74287.1 protein kinase [Ornithinibacillus gellani]
MNHNEYIKLLKFFDDRLWDRKVTVTNYNYNGIILDYYFEMSILSVDYLDIYDYFSSEGDFQFNDTELLTDQFGNVKEEKRIKLVENIINILELSSFDKNTSGNIVDKVVKFLERNGIMVINTENTPIELSSDNKIDEGSYCNILFVEKNVLRKELNKSHKDDTNLQKRMKYEFENMQKLKDCPQILNVYSFDPTTHSYLMERADINLYEYLRKEVDISFQQRLKIIFDVLEGMKYAHDHSIIHRDLHLGNVLKIGNDFVISDFGLSKDESIERSLKSSATEKNNHIFIDPLAIGDFTKLDKKSDIYSLGKMIDYVFTLGANNTEHLLTFIVEKCTSRSKDKRYDTVDEIIRDIKVKLNLRDKSIDKKQVLENIQNNIFTLQVNEFIKELVETDMICDYLVKHRISSFGNLIVKMNSLDQISTLEAINQGYVVATGYRQFQNYDIFASIAYSVCENTDENSIYDISRGILEGCAQYRYEASNLLEKIDRQRI